jgi:hemolysin activation/secretion protein
VTLQVYEGFIDSAVYQGEHVPDVARNYVQKILDARPLTAAVLERYLLLLNDVPGLTAHAVLSPSPTTVGAAQLTLVVGTQRWSADAGLDNRLTESLGHARLMAGVSAADTLLAQERFSARLIASDSGRVAIGSLGWEQAWGSEGLRTNLALTGVKTRPELALAETSRSSAVDAGVSYPVLRSRSRNLSLHATLSAMNSRAVTREGGVVLFDDRVRAMRVGVTGDLADEWGGVSLVDLEASQGLGGSAGTPASRAGANPHFRKLTLFASRLQAVVPGVSVLAAFSGQTTGSTLFSSEQFGAGGEVFLRAFDPSELIGDRGWAAKLELRYLPRDDTLLYLFYDHAHVANVDAAQPVVGGATAGTAGLGLRYSADRWAAFVEAAQPLQRDVGSEGRRRARLFAGLRWAY